MQYLTTVNCEYFQTQYEFDKMYAKNAKKLGYDYLGLAEMCFDAVMAMALALNKTDNSKH